ncbi:2-dehydropantoate 2-reductase [Azoarcus sp. TTM-91]|uniref:ketopantoate reductase family protein n=1 Tax=Azoarcus sp. TTM-91 TaxID=2691581 RepID=UPI00145D24B6|nr:2-dehydropantoate 2-reductase [Azoarcus sp. TTM-91]NMG36698.1 2-dehydropantoate 2-reductase [Azoarcus sp. TTM-91]
MTSPAPKQRICIAGAGAIGCTIAARLAMSGQDVSVLARGATLETLSSQGIVLTDLEGTHTVPVNAGTAADFGVQDIIFLCCKSQDIAALLQQVKPLVDENTIVVPAINGVPWWYFHGEGGRFAGSTVEAVDPAGSVSALLPLTQIMGTVVFITAEASAPGQVTAKNPHLMMFGEPDNSSSERLQRLCAVVAAAGIEARPLERIRDKLWTKIIANASTNPLSVVAGATLEELYTEPALRDTVIAIMQEVLLVAASYGARVEIDPLTFLELGAAMGPVRTSMLQDYERGRALELGSIGDAVLELAARFDIPMTVTRKIIGLARFHGEKHSSSTATQAAAASA